MRIVILSLGLHDEEGPALGARTEVFGQGQPGCASPPSPSPSWPLVSREGYECKGSINCNTWVNFIKTCDHAVNTALVRTDAVNYGGKNSGLRKGSRSGKCEVFIEGPASCKTTGNKMWSDYQDIRNHGCGRCGFKTWGEGDECKTKIDFVLSG
ncbi:hypothetical protein GGTG_08737 [Gaeumannomyces tritici R3-111a-1]|uniref:Uncharacterized protein n=1 Tax=Gaeumannomyces tritici (strain R3-111a-1) TaxID=644352 RepID=J3P5E8_GAET3|nr:hypothetical protein GGTG_08737 [Gaeumannomyces tritici R3-111a-1]EJT74899.1 hypothetical protein GGTG_08737 [Gaeumannomyces tritici R3-111a-1]